MPGSDMGRSRDRHTFNCEKPPNLFGGEFRNRDASIRWKGWLGHGCAPCEPSSDLTPRPSAKGVAFPEQKSQAGGAAPQRRWAQAGSRCSGSQCSSVSAFHLRVPQEVPADPDTEPSV